MTTYLYACAPGYNLPLGSLTYVEGLVVNNCPPMYPPSSFGSYDPGQYTVNLQGIAVPRGFPSAEWAWAGNPGGKLLYGQARGLRSFVCGTLWSGTATVYTKTTNETAYERYNAVMTFPKFSESAPNFKAFTRYSIHLGHLVAL